jgi:translation initiation factor 3 subunit F
VHPLVILNILDQYSRRSQNNDRVIGTLLGMTTEGLVEVTNCFPVPHTENEQVAVDMEFHRNMYELHRKASPRETIVGWYATGNEITETSHLLQDFYYQGMNHTPVHITVDTSLQNSTMAINGYISSTVSFGETKLLTHFQPIPVELKATETERIAVDTLLQSADGQSELVSDLQSLESSIVSLQGMLRTVGEYIDNVNSGKVKPDPKLGRFLMQTLSELPVMETEQFEKLFNNSMQDLLMVVYLANLTRSQLAIAEKLQTLL